MKQTICCKKTKKRQYVDYVHIKGNEMSAVLIEKEGHIARLILNRPDKLNALNLDMALELFKCTEELKSDGDIKCVIVSGAGDHFMAGGDIDYFKSLVDAFAIEGESALPNTIFDLLHGAIINITSMDKPVIASVKGAVAGFGLSLMLACDMVVIADDAVLSVAYCKIGTSPDGGMTYFLPRVIGQKRAMQLAMTGERFSAEQAERWGMVNHVVSVDDLLVTTNKLTSQLVKGPSTVLARTKRLLNDSSDASLKQHLDEEAATFFSCMIEHDFTEGVTAFSERREATFK